MSSKDWHEILSASAPFDEAFGGLVGACVGAWLGAVPIPLDWDREWQKWPVTIVCGIYAGYLVGKLLGGTVALGRRFLNIRLAEVVGGLYAPRQVYIVTCIIASKSSASIFRGACLVFYPTN